LIFLYRLPKLGTMRALYPAIFYLFTAGSCVSTRDYAHAEQDRCDCLSGIKAPADEFCTEWNEKVVREKERLDRRMAGLSTRNAEKYEALLLEISHIQEERDTCLARIARFY
jgi:hypothetical protein